jgi:DNA (cytosine-5)-methyltransferase 1
MILETEEEVEKTISTSKAEYHVHPFINKTGSLVATDYKDPPTVLRSSAANLSVVRRLTPLECERLQGFPDGWTDIGEWVDSKGKTHKDADSPRYKALGNSIAIPFWEWMAGRMVAELKADGVEHPTMGSLFDGIGGFPLSFQAHGCAPVWASEIEEFPIAVTKRHFPEED